MRGARWVLKDENKRFLKKRWHNQKLIPKEDKKEGLSPSAKEAIYKL